MTKRTRHDRSESNGGDGHIDELLDWTDDEPHDGPSPSLVPVTLAAVYCLVMPVVVGAWIAHLLAAPDPSAVESVAELVYGPYADRVLFMAGITQASSGYLLSTEASVWAGAVPLMIAAAGPAIVHALVFVLTWWGVAGLARRRRSS